MTARDTVGRLVDSRQESTELRSLLEAGITDDVTDYDFSRGLETHLAAVGPSPGGGGPAAPAGAGPGASSAAGATSAKALALAIGVPIVSAIAAFAIFATHDPVATGPTAATRAANTPVEAVAPAERAHESVTAASRVDTDEGSAIAPSDNTPLPSSRVAAGAQRQSGTQSSKVTLAENEPAAPRQDIALGASDDHPTIHRSFPEGPVESHRSTAASAEPAGTGAARAAAPATAASPVVREEPRPSEEELARAERAREGARRAAENTLQREMEELMRAKRALSNDPKLALQLAEHGQREFKQSLLSEEREHVLLLALIGVGRVSEAERRAAPYLAKHPDSPFAKRVRAALEARK